MIVCGTGHRPAKLGGYSAAVYNDLVMLATVALAERPWLTYVISGMALGWDQALAEAAYNLGIPFTAAIPFPGQEEAWPQESQDHYWDLMCKASEVHAVCDAGYAAWKMQKRNEWMVDASQWCMALYDGTSGGTANCVRYAEKMLYPDRIINLWEDWIATR